jgi:4-carboxymuconolactone decarboxylase
VSLRDSELRLARFFAACVTGNWPQVRAVLHAAPADELDRRWREVALMVHVFAGVPRGVEAYAVIESAGGLGPLEPEERLEPDSAGRTPTDGEALFARIYAESTEDVRAMLARGHPLFARGVLEYAYGRILCRPGITPDRRELYACAALAVMGQERQLASHARGAVRCGATQDEVLAVIEAVADLASAERMESARLVARRFSGPIAG